MSMDNWQKLEISSKVIAAILIPLAVAYLANEVSQSNKQRDSETKFVEIASTILAKEPSKAETPESKSLRKWAVDVINKFSGVPMSQETADALIQTTALPQLTAQTQIIESSADPIGTWGVIFGGDTTLAAAQDEVTKTSEKMGIGKGTIFRRAGSFRSVKIYLSRSEAEDALGKARAVRDSSYIVNMSKWCPTSEEKGGYFECAAP